MCNRGTGTFYTWKRTYICEEIAMNDIAGYVEDLARRAKQASRSLGFASDEALSLIHI